MIVPNFWAEARLQHREPGRQVTVRRFGWSDTSEAEAQAHAETRVQEALARILKGEKISKRERKLDYGGEAGLPIREEILERQGEVVITRNSYGAHCLNTANVLFADIDFAPKATPKLTCSLMLILMGVAVWAGWRVGSWPGFVFMILGAPIVGASISVAIRRVRIAAAGGLEKCARDRVERFVASHPDWRLRLYRTPAGFRVLVLHRVFDPAEPAVAEFFAQLETDPLYIRLCRRQNCFRARVSAKPWRIGMNQRMPSRAWPVPAEAAERRAAWVAEYEERARGYAACHVVGEFGQGMVQEIPRVVGQWHDELCRVESGLPMA